MVASGVLDLFVLIGGGPWDHAAPAVTVEEAGGRFTDITGEPRIATDVGIFSNGVVHAAVLQKIGG
jgi:histidinol-phosphatase